MELTIYNKEGQLKATVSPADSSTLTEGLMTDYILSLSFVLFDCVQLDVNDYVDFLGKRYWMLEAYIPNQKSTIEWNYNTKFYGIESVIRRALCLKTVDNEMSAVFSLTAPAIEHVRLVVGNINRVMGTTDWKVGEVEATANLTIDYNATYCDAALSSIATAADTEYWIDGLTVNLCRCEHGELLSLGYENGLKEITLDTNENAKFFTRLFPLGSTRNIDASKYGSSRLHLPGGVKYVEQNIHYGIIEHSEEATFSGIYPRRVGKVGTVRHETKKGEDGKYFDIYYFTDPEISFNPNDYEIGGLVKMIVFETGDLAGRDFEVNYNAEKKEFEIVTQWPYGDDMQLPGALVPATGNEYILYNITMPTEYYAIAEAEFATAVTAYMEKNKRDKSVYKAPTDYIDLNERGIALTVGQRVHLMSDKYFPASGNRDSRITRISRKVNEPLSADIEISDMADPGGKAVLTQDISEAKHYAQVAIAGLPDMIKSWENTPASDSNLYTAKKTLMEILRRALKRDQPDQTDYLLKLLGGALVEGGLTVDHIQSPSFSAGAFGTGYSLKQNPDTGKSYFEVDEIYVRLKAYFDTLEIKHLSHVGGQIVLSPASMKCVMVAYSSDANEPITDIDNSALTDSEGSELMAVSDIPVGVYRCYLTTTDGDKTINNEFVAGDQAQCREFNIKSGVYENVSNQYYWRKVVAVGDNYIDLSIEDCDTGSMIPHAGDTIVTVGNREDKTRQHVIMLSTIGDDAPSIKQYAGINDYSMLNKEVTVLSPKGNKITGQFVIQPGSTGGDNLEGVGSPDFAEIKKEIIKAVEAASNAQQDANDAQGAVSDLNKYVDGAFADGIIEESEAKAIEKYINVVKSAKSDMEATYNKLYANSYLEGAAKTDLLNAKINFFGAVDALLSSINAAITDGKTTVAEKQDVDNKYTSFNTAYASLSITIEAANKAIQDKLKSFSTSAQKAAEYAQDTADAANTAASNAGKSISDLNKYVDGAFADGIIEESEAKAIEKYINVVKSAKSTVEATYNTLYVNAYLTGTAKTDLLNAKVTLFGAVDALLSSINTAISDGKTTTGEKQDVDNKYSSFNTAYADFSTAVEAANKTIQDKLKEYTDGQVQEVKTSIENIPAATKDALAKNLGYGNYTELELAAANSNTLIKGGKINTTLIEATAIVTAQLISDAIAANTLNVGDRFKVAQNGIVELVDAIVSGRVRSSNEGRRVEFNPADGSIDLYSDNVLWGTIGWSGVYPKIRLYGKNTGVYTEVMASKIIFNNLGGATGSKLSSLTIDIENFLRTSSVNNGILYSGEDGIVRIKDGESVPPPVTYEITLIASPQSGGTVSGGGEKESGSIGVISATPNSGYAFSHWSNGNTNPSQEIAWNGNKSLTAYFVIETVYYTVTLAVSPAGSGTVSGGGRKVAGSTDTIKASPNSGYAFSHWSDGNTRMERVLTWSSDETITAYFTTYIPSTENILSIGAGIELIENYKEANAHFSISWFASVLSISFYSTNGNTAVAMFSMNKGMLAEKVKPGIKYRLEFSCWGTTESGTFNTIIPILGKLNNPPNDLGGADSVGAVVESYDFGNGTSGKRTINIDFTASRTSTSSDVLCFVIASDRTTVGMMISGMSLKEI